MTCTIDGPGHIVVYTVIVAVEKDPYGRFPFSGFQWSLGACLYMYPDDSQIQLPYAELLSA